MPIVEKNLPERVIRLETTMETVVGHLDEIKQEMRELRGEMNVRFQQIDTRFDNVHILMGSWLKWFLGFTFSSWLTLMVSIWLKR